MRKSVAAVWVLAVLALTSPGCTAVDAAPNQELVSPAGKGSSAPFLFATSKGDLLMSWLEPVEGSETTAVKVARFKAGKWSVPVTVLQRDDLFVNWADFPSVVEAADGTLVVHWLQKNGKGTYAYDVRVARSLDGGRTWGSGIKLHDDDTETEHGFAALQPHASGPTVSAVWLDGREMSGHGHDGGGDMTLRYATTNPRGGIQSRAVLDERTCECCTTDMAMTAEGWIVAYRDRSADEVRDIAVVRQTATGWTAPRVVHPDGWKIEGCPVNGPQLDADGRKVALAWFTAPDDKGRLNVSFSGDAGGTFSTPVRIDNGSAVGRVDLLLLEDGTAFVSWIEGIGNAAAVVARRVSPDGRTSAIQTVAPSSAARGAGFPRIARIGDQVFVAWTDVAAEKRVRVARVEAPAM